MLLTRLYHLKVTLVGDRVLEKKGKKIPCIKCGSIFKSYVSYGGLGYVYYTHCRTCELLKRAKDNNKNENSNS